MVHQRYRTAGGEDASVRAEAAGLASAGVAVDLLELPAVPRGPGAGAALLGSLLGLRVSARLRRALRECATLHLQNPFPTISASIYREARALGVPVVQSLRNYRFFCAAGTLRREGSPCLACPASGSYWPGVRHSCYRRSRASSLAMGILGARFRSQSTVHRAHFIAVSRRMRQLVIELGLPADRVSVKANPVVPDPGAGPGGRELLFAGRLTEEKGAVVLLQALARSPQLAISIFGDGPLAGAFQALAAERPNVRFQPWSAQPEVLEAMRHARATVVPSTWEEPFGRAAAESLACGTPVIASAIGGLTDIVVDGASGILVPAGDASALVAAMERIAALSADAYHGWRLQARSRFESELSMSATTARLLEIYSLGWAAEP